MLLLRVFTLFVPQSSFFADGIASGQTSKKTARTGARVGERGLIFPDSGL